MRYELYYWPGIQGRGEFVRLALEEGGADYRDLALVPEEKGGGVPAMMKFLDGAEIARPPFAPPFLKAGRRLIGQTANILLFLGPRLGLAPRDADGRLWTHQLQLTIADFVLEIHDTHHPIGGAFYYEEQKAAAMRRSREFLAQRLPKFLGYFERVIERNAQSDQWLVGKQLSYADLSMAQVVAGLRYAFPKASKKALRICPGLRALHDEVFARSRIKRYAASGRRLAFNNDGIFRRYPELDA
ncbi:MAG TPA: glutathione S-transferase [Burkholderiales bacterium]|nr:glutathione S-transferase [Burkholderiales bacterium]